MVYIEISPNKHISKRKTTSSEQNMIHKFFFCLLLLIFLSACATEEKYSNNLNKLIGENESYLLKIFGKPSSKKIINSHTKILTYTNLENMYVPSEFYEYNTPLYVGADDVFYPFNDMYIYNPMSQYLGVNVTFYCQTSFLLENGVIKSWQWKGNNCTKF